MLYTEREIGRDINGHNGQEQEQALGCRKVQKRKVFAQILVFCIHGEIDKELQKYRVFLAPLAVLL